MVLKVLLIVGMGNAIYLAVLVKVVAEEEIGVI